MLLDKMELSAKGFPKEFPVIWLATDESLLQFKKAFIDSKLKGYDPDMRVIKFCPKESLTFTISEIYDRIIELEKNEIDEDLFNIMVEIPHWNPIQDANYAMTNYIQFYEEYQNNKAADELRKQLFDIVKEGLLKREKERCIH
jgi:hypothetical protein